MANPSDWLVLVDCGHGVETPGKRSPSAFAGLVNDPLYLREYAWAREVGPMVCDLLMFQGPRVVLLQKDERDEPLASRTARVNDLARKHGVSRTILLSIHCNAAGNGHSWRDARGWAVYTSPGRTESDAIADAMYRTALEEFPGGPYGKAFNLGGKQKPVRADWSDGDPDYEAAFWMLTKSVCPAVLVENFFQDNREDVAWLKSDTGKGSCAWVMAEGILRYILGV